MPTPTDPTAQITTITTTQITTSITTKQLAARWQCSCEKLELDRYMNRGVPFFKIGRHVRYHMSDVIAFEATQMRTIGRAS